MMVEDGDSITTFAVAVSSVMQGVQRTTVDQGAENRRWEEARLFCLQSFQANFLFLIDFTPAYTHGSVNISHYIM